MENGEQRLRALRKKAEEFLESGDAKHLGIPTGDIQQMLHELCVHQIELQMQNEELRRTEQFLRESKDRFADLYDNAPVGYVTTNGDGVILEANRTILRMLGLNKEQVVSNPLQGFVLGSDRKQLTQYLAGERQERCEPLDVRMLKDSGDIFHVRIESKRILKEDKVQGVFRITISDIESLKEVEKALSFERNRLFLVLDQLPACVQLVAPDHAIRFANNFSREILGQRSHQACCLEEAGTGNNGKHCSIAQVLESGKPLEWVWHDQPTQRIFQVYGYPFVDHDDSQLVLQMAVDITSRVKAEEERRRFEEKLQQAQKLESLGVLAGGIAHDFNNLLLAILGNASLVLSKTPESDPNRECLEEIEKAGQRAAELTQQMLAYSGKGRMVIQAIDLTELVEEMSDLLRVSVSRKALIHYRFERQMPLIEGDPTQIRQVLMNLITNASEALEERTGTIVVTTGIKHCDAQYLQKAHFKIDLQPGEYVFFEVKDTGVGISKENLKKIFDPFFTTKFTGRGLGLAAVLGILRSHNAALVVESQPGRGSAFRVLLPVTEKQIERPKKESFMGENWESVQKETILLVDDESSVRNVASRMLRQAGFEVVVAADGIEALEQYEKHATQISVVLLDLTMPRLSGEETFKRLRELDGNLPVILSSGFSEQEANERFADRGMSAFIQKPYRFKDLLSALKRVLSSKAPAEQE